MARPGLRRPDLRDPLAVHRRHSGRGSARADPPHLHRGGVRHARDHAAEDARTRSCAASAVQRPDAGLQGHGDATARRPVRVRAETPRRDAEHPRRHFRRHRQRGRVRDARQGRRQCLHAQPAWPHEPLPASADVQPAGRNIHNIAITGVFDDCQDIVKAVSTTWTSSAATGSAPSTRSTGRACWPRSSTTSPAGCRRRRATRRRSASPSRPAISAMSAPATSRG